MGSIARIPERLDPRGRRARIGITGSFGRGNYGDELYVKTYQQLLGPSADLYLLSALPRQPYFRELREAHVDLMDAVVLGGGDLLTPHNPIVDYDFINATYLRRPVHVAGIGVQRSRHDPVPETVQKWKRFLTDPAIASISTRDPRSKEWIEEHIAPSVPVTWHPDWVCALDLPPAERPEGAPILGIVTRHVKGAEHYTQLEEIGRRLSAQGWRVRHIVGGVGKHGAKDLENSKLLDIPGKETVSTESLDGVSRALGQCTLVLSMKLHTTLVATMYGVPTIAVNPVPKAKEFMGSIGREELVVSPTSPKLAELIDAGVPDVPMERVAGLRDAATRAMSLLEDRISASVRESADASRRRAPGLLQRARHRFSR